MPRDDLRETWRARLAELDEALLALELDPLRELAPQEARETAERATEEACAVRDAMVAFLKDDVTTAPRLEDLARAQTSLAGAREALVRVVQDEKRDEGARRAGDETVRVPEPNAAPPPSIDRATHLRELAVRLSSRRRQLAGLLARGVTHPDTGVDVMDARAEEAHMLLRRRSRDAAPLDEVERMIEGYEQDVISLLAVGRGS